RLAASTPPTDSIATDCPERCPYARASSLRTWRVAIEEIPRSFAVMARIVGARAPGSKPAAALAAISLRHNCCPGIHLHGPQATRILRARGRARQLHACRHRAGCGPAGAVAAGAAAGGGVAPEPAGAQWPPRRAHGGGRAAAA